MSLKLAANHSYTPYFLMTQIYLVVCACQQTNTHKTKKHKKKTKQKKKIRKVMQVTKKKTTKQQYVEGSKTLLRSAFEGVLIDASCEGSTSFKPTTAKYSNNFGPSPPVLALLPLRREGGIVSVLLVLILKNQMFVTACNK